MPHRISISSILLTLAMAVLIATPLIIRPSGERPRAGAKRLIIITPHNQQIRWEFARAFSLWHEANFEEPVEIDFRRPGGTSEIRAQLIAIYEAAVRRGDIAPDGTITEGAKLPYDLCFGGGTYEHGQLKRGVRTVVNGAEVQVPISEPVEFEQQRLDEWFGENRIGVLELYDPDRFWFGLALSSFGILANRDMLSGLGLPEPEAWEDLTDPRYAGWLALGDPRLSGSVATTYESILNMYGWDEGWRILRAMCASARFFASDSKKVVLDVSRGEAAAGVAIDFYGRYQAQAVTPSGGTPADSRLDFIEPRGKVLVDPDPISLLRGAPHRELAVRFIEFCLTEEGQALWQLRRSPADAPLGTPGPERFELRRMPIRRVMYERFADRFVDRIDPFADATRAETAGWRSMIAPMFAAFAIDVHDEIRAAWRAMHEARLRGATDDQMREMEAIFYAMPRHQMTDGSVLLFSAENYRAIRNEWRDRDRAAEFKIRYARFFRQQYRKVIALAGKIEPTTTAP